MVGPVLIHTLRVDTVLVLWKVLIYKCIRAGLPCTLSKAFFIVLRFPRY
jgi:hypothetical protein